ncbi:hypothetical protein JCM10908_000537 [Rhodotorula pacifica]|uniref:uncharacterized protein n=1 Tax=Rhodotorula pacifica TaxID=1495444 RepID=UPI00317CADE0
MSASELPPGPANLLDDALQHPLDSPLLPRKPEGSHPTSFPLHERKADRLNVSTRSTSTTSAAATVAESEEVVAAAYDKRTGSLRPIPARSLTNEKVKRTGRTTFTPRFSHFDRNNVASAQDPFRGLYTLFWILLFVGGFRTIYGRWIERGGLYRWHFAELISEDAWALALSDVVLVGTTVLCVPFAKTISSGWVRYYWTGLIFQHIAQTAYLFIAIRWTFHREWPWVQSGFLTLHALTMLMKVHSYCSLNGELAERARKMRKDERELNKVLDAESGGRRAAEAAARDAWEKACSEENSAVDDGPMDKPSANLLAVPANAASGSSAQVSSDEEQAQATALRQRRISGRRRSTSPAKHKKAPLSKPTREEAPQEGIETLTWHPQERIAHLAMAVCDAKDALSSGGKENISFPQNVTFLNFIDYLLVPTLVYELEYPRTTTIRPLYVLEKTLATFGTFSLLILIVEHFILPNMPRSDQTFFASVLDLALPFCVCYLLIFFIIFEAILNVFAEVTRFSDRAFYGDWWNSTSFDEFSRKWNRPVHTFLLRHVYATTISTYRLSKFSAAFITFLLSAAVHELVMLVVTKKVRLYLFLMQMAQLPLIMVGRAKIFRQYPALGNLFFWLGLMSGFPLLAALYIRC